MEEIKGGSVSMTSDEQKQLNDYIIETMSIIAKSAVEKASVTMIEEGEVLGVIDEAMGVYSVSYLDNTITASSAYPEVRYQKGDKVNILFTNNDMGKMKFILGCVEPSLAPFQGSSVGYYSLSGGSILDGLSKIIKMSSYKNIEISLNSLVGNNFNQIFNEYTKNYSKSFLLKILLKTIIPEEQHHAGGKFGIRINIPVTPIDINGQELEKTIHSFELSSDNLSGNPFSFSDYTYNDIVFSLDEYENFDPTRTVTISAFCNGFRQNDTKPNDIFIKEISLDCVQEFEENNTGYTLVLTATDGPFFDVQTTAYEKILSPILRFNGRKTSIEDYDCYWFKENCLVKNQDSKGYNGLGGVGWECLNDTYTNETGEIVLDKSKKTLAILQSEVLKSCKYKCVLVVNGEGISKIIEIKNLSSKININLISNPEILYPNSGKVTCSCLVTYLDKPANTSLRFEWNRYDFKGNLIPFESGSDIRISDRAGEDASDYTIPASYINVLNTIECAVYLIDASGQRSLIGSVQKPLSIAEMDKLDFNLVLENGNILYKYDAYGNSPLAPGYVGVPGSVPAAAPAISFRIFKKDGSEFTESEYGVCKILWQIPKQSLFSIQEDLITSSDDNYYYFNGKTLSYGINSKYDANRAIGQITLNVDFQGVTLQTKPNIVFIKEGENGTNGSSYVARITHNDYEYGENGRKLKFVWKCSDNEGNGAWYYHNQNTNTLVPFSETDITLGLNIYQGSNKLTQNEVNIEWGMFDSAITNSCFSIDSQTGELSLANVERSQWKEPNNTFCNIVQAKIKVGNEGENKVEYIFAYYPIEITRLSYSSQELYDSSDASLIPQLDGGFSEVTYTEDGKNPSYVSNSPFKCVSKSLQDANLRGYYKYTWESSSNLSTTTNGGDECTFVPISNFDNNISQNYVKVAIDVIKGYSEDEQERAKKDSQDTITKYNTCIENVDEIHDNIVEWLQDYNVNIDTENNNLLTKYLTASYSYLTVLDNCIKFLSEIKKQFIQTVRPTFVNNASTYIKDDYQIEETFGDSYLTRNYQNYINRLCNFDLTKEYDERDIDLSYIDADYIRNRAEFEENFSTHLTQAGLDYYNEVRQNFSTLVTNYNAGLEDFFIFESGAYKYSLDYSNFREFFTKAIAFVNNSNVISFEDFVLLDTKDTILTNMINDLKVIYQAITNLCKNYKLILKQTRTQDENFQILYDFSNYDNEYFLNLNNEILNSIQKYGVLNNDEHAYILSESIELTLQNKKDNYEFYISTATDNLNSLDTIFKAGSAAIIHLKPLVMLVNRYGNAYLNDWDGNKLYIDEENGQYLFSPQVGAGTKEEGRFTGIIIGGRGSNGIDSDSDIGLFGYNRGNQTIFLDAKTGGATFGLSGGGQIIIDPNDGDPDNPKAIIQSGNYIEKDTEKKIAGSGMQIDLAEPSIKFGSKNFSVNKEGQLVSQEGYIGGWEIGVNNTENSNRGKGASLLHSPFYTRTLNGLEINDTDLSDVIYLDSNAKYDEKTDKFVTADENFTSAIYTGEHNTLDSDSKGFFLSSDGMSINSFFKVNKDALYFGQVNNESNRWKICYNVDDPTKARAYIAFGTEAFTDVVKKQDKFHAFSEDYYDTTLNQYSGDAISDTKEIYIGTDGISLGEDSFWVTSKGTFKANKGYIGDWMIINEHLLGGLRQYNNHTEFTMEINSQKGYISHTNSSLDGTKYGTPENELDVFKNDNSYILNENGLFYGGWKTYLDNEGSYIHSEYGDIGGFHFTGSTLETGLVPQKYKTRVYEYSLGSDGKDYWQARVLPQTLGLTPGNMDIKNIRNNFIPYDQDHPNDYSNYMRIDPIEQCITFNALESYWDSGSGASPFSQGSGVYLGRYGIELGNTFRVSSSGDVYIREGSIVLGSNFSVNNNGELSCSHATINGDSSIAGWSINDNNIYSIKESSELPDFYEGVILNKNGELFGGSCEITGDEPGADPPSFDEDSGSCWALHKDGSAEFAGIRVVGGTLTVGDKDSDEYFFVNSSGKLTCHGIKIDGGSISIGESGYQNFKVNSEGAVTIDGGKITLYDGDDKVFVANDKGVTIDGSGYIKSNNFKITKDRTVGFKLLGDGTFYCADAWIGGVHFQDVADGSSRIVEFPANTTISAPQSNWGGWIINETSISKGDTTLSTSDLTTVTGHFTGRVDVDSLYTHGLTDIGGSAKFRSDATFDGTATFSSNATFNGGTTTFKNIETNAISASQTVLCKNGLNVSGGNVIIGSKTLENYIKDIIDKDYLETIITQSYIKGKIGSSTYAPYSVGGYAPATHSHTVSGTCTIENVGNGTISGTAS
jgi:hypothetical protein